MTEKFAALKKAVCEAAVLSGLPEPAPLEESFPLNEIDSLGRAEIIVCVETEFAMQLTNKEILEMQTYGDLVKIIKAHIHA